jgi:hypothetical protein
LKAKLLASILIELACCRPLPAQLLRHTIRERTARGLVQRALVALGEDLRWVHIGPWQYYWAPEFYTFSAWRPGPVGTDGVGVLQTWYFAVNPWTGDVWDAMGCTRITSPTIQNEQESIWKRSQLPAEVREAIRNKSPADCSANQRQNDKKEWR